MLYLANTAHRQFLGLVMGFIAWILIMFTAGLNEWRLWHVADTSTITSGVAWVGIWKTCFYSHVLSGMENCQSISISDPFVPAEILAAQVLMIVAILCGLAANVSAAFAMRMVYFSLQNRRHVRLFFLMTGTLYVLTSLCSMVPLMWNMSSVLNNRTIDFPPEFHLPSAPVWQQVGSAIIVGSFASILIFISGLLFLSYRYVWHKLSSGTPRETRDPHHGPWTETTPTPKSEFPHGGSQGRDNPAFHNEEVSH